MWNPIWIQIQNLFSHKDTLYEFTIGKTTIVYGKNNDDDGCDSNGSGKSSILEAIRIVLTGESSLDVNKDDFINENASSCLIILNLIDHNNNVLELHRKIFRSKSPEIRLFYNGIWDENITGVSEFNSEIIKFIGINKEDLFNYFIISDDCKSFLSSSDSDKKQIISRFSKINFLDNILLKIDEDSSQVNDDYQFFINIIEVCKSKIEFINKQIGLEENSDIANIVKSQIKNLNNELLGCDDVISKNKDKININNKLISSLTIEINQLKSKLNDTSLIEKNIKDDRLSVQDKESLIHRLNRKKSGLEIKLEHKITCPNCEHMFIINNEEDINLTIESINNDLKLINIDINKHENEIEKLNKNIKLLKIKINKEQSIILSIKEVESKKQIAGNENTSFNNIIISNKQKILKLKESINKIKSEGLKNSKLINLRKQLEQINIDLYESGLVKDSLLLQKEEFDFWKYHFGKKGFATYLINKVIKYIEGMINLTLQKYNTSLSVELIGFTKLKNGDLREKIDVFVSKNGKKKGKFGRFSKGQKARLNISSILTFHKLINMSTDGRGLNFLSIDEKFDEGLDLMGQKASLEILEKSNITTMLISHHNNDIGAKNCLLIQLDNEISKIVQEFN